MPIFRGELKPKFRRDHWEQSTSIESFIEYSKGYSLEGLRARNFHDSKITDFYTYRKDTGPDRMFVYVKDPLDPPRNGQPGGVIDMKHFISSAMVPVGMGEYAGAALEVWQSQKPKSEGTSFNEEDYKSNFLGVVFGNNYWKKDNDVSDELQQFFQDYQNGQLKGFWPTVDRSIAELGRMGAEGLKQLEQLADFISDYSVRLGQQGVQHLQHFRRTLEKVLKMNPIEGIQRLIDKVSLAEQTYLKIVLR
jgi:hypothetical protein